MANTDTTAALARLDHGEHQALLAPASAHGRFVDMEDFKAPEDLEKRVKAELKKNPHIRWDAAVEAVVSNERRKPPRHPHRRRRHRRAPP
jgi:hypothetical protein